MKRNSALAAFGLCLLTATLCGPAQAQTAAADTRAEAPIREVVLSNGQHRYAVPITVGGVAIEAGLDSGSTGLRILPGVVPAGVANLSGRHAEIDYGAGTQFDGVIGEADMTIGVSGRARFQQIQKIGCHAGQPCPAEKVPVEQFGIQGSGLPNEGFKAILGVNMADNDAPNPLVEMGVRRWIIELPRPGEGKPGRLVLNPTDAEVAGYVAFPLDRQFSDVRGGNHDTFAACLVNRQTKASVCGPTLFDTGAPGVAAAAPAGGWPQGTPVMMTFYDNGAPVLSAPFTVGRGPGTTLRRTPPAQRAAIILGILPYFDFSVLYDPKAKTIGLKAR